MYSLGSIFFFRKMNMIVFILAYPSSSPYPRPQQQQQSSMYPPLPGNQGQQYRAPYGATSSPNSQQPAYNHTTVVVQPSPTYGGGGGGYGGYGGYGGGSGIGSSLGGVGLGLAGGALLGGKIFSIDLPIE
jgi:hypothetical protein